MSKKSVFNHDWCDKKLNPNWSTWLEPDEKDPCIAKCSACKKTFSLSNMGRQAIISHEKGPKHKKNIKLKNSGMQHFLANFMNKSPTSDSVPVSKESAESTPTVEVLDEGISSNKGAVSGCKKTIQNYFLNDQVTKAEIIWCLRTVMTHSSFRSNSDFPDICKLMFPDSEIAKKFQLKKDKTSYTICFGLAPFFKNELLAVLSSLESYVICFDESLNKVVQKNQMDIHVRFWQNNVNAVKTRYLTSVFLGHSDAVSLLIALKSSVPSSDIKKILQLSMDGPNVNHKLHSLLQNDLKENTGSSKSLLDIGSCGLHIVHGAFKIGHKSTSWDLNKFLYAVFNLFKDSPARRADFVRLTNTNVFPLKFCSIRWLDSSAVAQRALDILPHLRVFVQELEAKNAEPDTKTYDTVKSMLKCSELLEAKLGFFISVASELQGFLMRFQADKPMAPFLYEEMYLMLHSLMKRFIKNCVIENSSAMKLMKVDVTQKCNVLPITDVNIGFAARRSLNESKASDTVKLNFKKECLSFLQKMTLKLIERNPLRFKLVRGISCLSPNIISSSSSSCVQRIEIALDRFVDCNQMTAVTADKVKSEFCKFIASPHVKKAMSEFKHESERLDVFYSSLLDKNTNYQNLFMFIKNVLIMSHGNAAVESGFSINKAVLIENMQEKSVIALRTVYDAVSNSGGLFKVDISKNMILAARNAHSYYQEELKAKKRIEKESEELQSKKKRAAEEIKELKMKKMKIQQDAEKQIAELDGLIKDLNN